MKNAGILNLLERSDYFGGLSGQSREALASVCDLETFEKREFLFLEGRRGHSAYLLASGGIQLVKTSAEGREVVIKTVEPGEVFAEVVLFEQDAYPVTAVALKKSAAYKLPKSEFLRLLGNVGFRDDFIRVLMARLRYLADRVFSLTACDVEERFFRFLEEQYGRKERYEMSLSKKDMAAAIGTAPETLSRLVRRLKREGKLAWKGKTLVIRQQAPGARKERMKE